MFFTAFAFAVLAAFADAKLPLVSAEGRLVGAYQDNMDAAFVCLVIERGGKTDQGFMIGNFVDFQPGPVRPRRSGIREAGW